MTTLNEQMNQAIGCGTAEFFGQQIAQGFREEMAKQSNWLNTGHSREYWLCELAGRAMQGLLSNDNAMIALHDGGFANDMFNGVSRGAISHAAAVLNQLESELKGTTNATD